MFTVEICDKKDTLKYKIKILIAKIKMLLAKESF